MRFVIWDHYPPLKRKRPLWGSASLVKVTERLPPATLLKETLLWSCLLSFAIRLVVSNHETQYINQFKPTQDKCEKCDVVIIAISTHFLPMLPFTFKFTQWFRALNWNGNTGKKVVHISPDLWTKETKSYGVYFWKF